MAQAGMFVPGKMIYTPFNRIVTRFSGNDSLREGKSSFVVEMTELKTILKYQGPRTLVLGDELCRGTESSSGTAITTATINSLLKAKCPFIFSTHMHHLPKIPEIKEHVDKTLSIQHLSTHLEGKELIFDRKLRFGPGLNNYGIMVCESLGFDDDFLHECRKISSDLGGINDSYLSTKTSNYNKEVYVDSCKFCNSQDNLHTHHIDEQNMADCNGFIDHNHKNKASNLLILCQDCHIKLHQQGNNIVKKQAMNNDLLIINP